MRRFITLAFATFAFTQLSAQTFPVVNLRENGPKNNRVNIVILPDGFTAAEQASFNAHADTIRSNAFTYTPLKEYANFFNVYCINAPSKESGVNHPGTATDVPETDPVYVVDNYFKSTFDYGGVHRALVATDYSLIDGVLAYNFPDYDLVYILSNTNMYGGTGGIYATGTLNSYSVKIAVHEWGHTFANLADEYWAGWGSEKPNCTANADPTIIKWKNWLGYKAVGIYPYGVYAGATWYRPHEDCLMQYLDTVLCPVCKEAYIDQLYRLVFPIENPSPLLATAVNYTGTDLPFSVQLIKPEPNTIKMQWQLNGTALSSTDTSVTIPGSALSIGTNELKAIATDTTRLGRTYLPASGYQFSVKWKIENSGTGIAQVGDVQQAGKFSYKVYPVPVHGLLNLECDNTTATQQLDCSILDISGKRVLQRTIPLVHGANRLQLNTSQLLPGVYQLLLKGDDINVTAKIMIE